VDCSVACRRQPRGCASWELLPAVRDPVGHRIGGPQAAFKGMREALGIEALADTIAAPNQPRGLRKNRLDIGPPSRGPQRIGHWIDVSRCSQKSLFPIEQKWRTRR